MRRLWDFVWLLAISLTLTMAVLIYIGKRDMKLLREMTKKDWNYIVTGNYRW